MNFNNNNKHEIKTKFRFIDNEIQGSTKGRVGGLRNFGNRGALSAGGVARVANGYGLRVC